MMQIFLFRHGIAEELGPDDTDASRRLTDKGAEKTRQAAQGLKHLIDRLDVILTSPKVRAQQTAEIAGQVFGVQPKAVDALADHDAESVCDLIRLQVHERVMLVGHEPTFSAVVERMCGGYIELKKAGCACLDWEDGDTVAMLRWLVTPKLLVAAAM